MRKIAHVISTPEGIGGAERIMLALVKGGMDRGWDQVVLDPFDLRPNASRLRNAVTAIDGARYEARATRRYRELPGARSWLRSRLVEHDAAVVQVHLFHALALVASLGQVQATTVLTHHHGNIFKVTRNRFRAGIDRRAGLRMDCVIAPSSAVEEFVLKSYRYPRELVSLIVNGWEGTPVRTEVTSGEPVIVCVANFREQKDHVTLLRAFSDVLSAFPRARLRLVGEGPLQQATTDLAHALGVTGSVDFLGTVDDVWSVLNDAQVFVLTSRYEPLGIAVLEAMASGLPVVASDVDGLQEVVQHEQSGILVPPGDPRKVAEAVIRLLKSSTERKRMGSKGMEIAEDWKMEVTVDRYFELYERLLEH